MTLTKILVPICFYCLNCTKFGQLIIRKKIKIVATRLQILRLKCTKFDFGCGSKLNLSRPTSKRRDGWEGKGREGREREREGTGWEVIVPFQKS